MRGFQFKLQSVLDFRAEQVQQAQQMLSLEMNTLQGIQSRMTTIDDEMSSVLSEASHGTEGFDLEAAQNTQGYLFTLKQKRRMSQYEYDQQNRMVQRCQLQLKEKVVAQKTIEKLKEKRQAEFVRKMDKIENDRIEEVALRQYQMDE